MYFIALAVSTLIFAGAIFSYLWSGRSSAFHPATVYLAFHGWVFVLRPWFAYLVPYHTVYRVYGFFPSEATKIAVIVAANLGLLAFVAGAMRAGNLPMRFAQSGIDLVHRRLLLRAFLPVMIGLGLIGVASLWASFTQTQWTMRTMSHDGVSINTTSNGWFVEAQMLLVPLAVLIAWLFRFRWYSFLPLLLFVVIKSGTGGRGAFVVACAGVGLAWMFEHRRKWPPPRAWLAAVVVLGLFYAVGQDRGQAVKTFVNEGKVVTIEKQWGFMESMDWANMEFFEYIVETVPRKTGTYGWFVDNLQLFTEPIPRVLWKGKPVGPPIKMFNLFDYGNPVGMTYSLPGYGWMQAGYGGVVLWCGLWGLALGWVYNRFVASAQGNFAVAAYFAFLPIFIIAYRDGGIVTIFRTGVFYLAPVLAWMLAARALKIPDPATLVRHALQRRSRASRDPGEPEAHAPARSRRAADAGEVVPRAWRRGAGALPAPR